MDRLIKQILMDGFSGISDTDWEDQKMARDILIDGKEL